MGRILAKAIGSGIGFTSEAIHAVRNRDKPSPSSSPTERSSSSTESSRTIPSGSVSSLESEPPAIAEKELERDTVRSDSLPTYDSVYPQNGGDEASWQLDEATEQLGLPSYEEIDAGPRETNGEPSEEMNAGDSEDEQTRKREVMIRQLVKMAGPPGAPKRLPCPVIIPQRRPGRKRRGFVRAYAPVLEECGISQDVFLKFISDFHKCSQASMWLRVIVVAASITTWSPVVAVMATAIAVQTVADTARQLQIRRRTNDYLDRVNEEIFKPRGQYAMIMKFSDKPPPGARKVAGVTPAEKLGDYFATEQVNFRDGDARAEASGSAQSTEAGSDRPEFNAAATISKYTHTQDHPGMNKFQKRMKEYREYSDQTRGEIQLPNAAPLIFPDIDRAAIRVRDGIAPKSTFQSGRSWVRDYLDRKEQIDFEKRHKGSAVAVPQEARKAFVSRYNDPNHPVNNGKLLSVLTGGHLYNPRPTLIDRARNQYHKSQEKKRAEQIAQGLPPSEPWASKIWRKKMEGIRRMMNLQEDVMYLIIVNMPTEEELQEAVAEMQYLMEHQKDLENQKDSEHQMESEQREPQLV